MNAPQYFPFLIDIFSRLINTSWRTEYFSVTHQKLPLQQSPDHLLLYLRSLFPSLIDTETNCLSPHMSSISTETALDNSNDISRTTSADGLNSNLQPESHDTISVFSNCCQKGSNYCTWLFPQFYTFLQVSVIRRFLYLVYWEDPEASPVSI